jgi:hypothetical protein
MHLALIDRLSLYICPFDQTFAMEAKLFLAKRFILFECHVKIIASRVDQRFGLQHQRHNHRRSRLGLTPNKSFEPAWADVNIVVDKNHGTRPGHSKTDVSALGLV